MTLVITAVTLSVLAFIALSFLVTKNVRQEKDRYGDVREVFE